MKTIKANYSFVLLAFSALLITGCSGLRNQKKISGNYIKETECLGVEMDGSQTVKCWGTGNRRADAIAQAKKTAVRDVLFKGIRNGKQVCNQKPIINEVNAQDKYEDYFNKFFADGGLYEKFTNLKDEPLKLFPKDRKGSTDGVEYGVIVRVLRAELKKQMIDDNILKTDND